MISRSSQDNSQKLVQRLLCTTHCEQLKLRALSCAPEIRFPCNAMYFSVVARWALIFASAHRGGWFPRVSTKAHMPQPLSSRIRL